MTVEQQVSPNVYPSAESVSMEPIAILTPREGVRRVLFRRQALAIRAIIRFLDKMGLDETSFPSNSKKLHNDIRPGRPYKSGIINPIMLGLIPYIADLGGTITPHPSDPPAPSTYDVYLPKDVRAKIQIKRRKVPIGVTFQLPYGNTSTGERAVTLHELMIDHLTTESAIPNNKLWRLVHGGMPYNGTLMSRLLWGIQQDLDGTGIIVEKLPNFRITEDGRNVRTHSSVYLNLSGYIKKLSEATEASRIPFVFTDEDVLAFSKLLSVYGAESILREHHVTVTSDVISAIYRVRPVIEHEMRRLTSPQELVTALIEKLLQLSKVEVKKIEGPPYAQKIFSIFKELDEQRMTACLTELYGEYTTYKR